MLYHLLLTSSYVKQNKNSLRSYNILRFLEKLNDKEYIQVWEKNVEKWAQRYSGLEYGVRFLRVNIRPNMGAVLLKPLHF